MIRFSNSESFNGLNSNKVLLSGIGVRVIFAGGYFLERYSGFIWTSF